MLLAPVDSDSLFRSAAVVSIHTKQLRRYTSHICMHAWEKAGVLLYIPVTYSAPGNGT